MSNGEIVYDDAYYIELGRQAAAAKESEVAAPAVPDAQHISTPAPASIDGSAPKALTFGPMPASTAPAAAPATQQSTLSDADIARILKAMGQTPVDTTPAKPVSKEDQRVLDVMARLFPTGRDAVVKARYSVGSNLSVVEIAYTPNTGTRRDTEALVYDDGTRIYVFGAV